jgi:hypothetical protein
MFGELEISRQGDHCVGVWGRREGGNGSSHHIMRRKYLKSGI